MLTWILAIPIAITVFFFFCLGWGIRQHRVKLRMKQFGNSMASLGGIVLMIYGMMLGVILIPNVLNLTNQIIAKLPNTDANTLFVIRGLPCAFVAGIFTFVAWFLYRLWKFLPFKYTDEEKELIKVENKRWNDRVRRALRLRPRQAQ